MSFCQAEEKIGSGSSGGGSARGSGGGAASVVYFRVCLVCDRFGGSFLARWGVRGGVIELVVAGNAGQKDNGGSIGRMQRSEGLDSSSDVSDDSEPEVDETDEAAVTSGRLRRDVRSVSFPSTSGCSTSEPLPNPAKKNPRPKWLPPGYRVTLYKGNPVYGFRMQLYCRTGYLLAIFPDKKVRGIDEDHPNALVEFSSVDFGEVRIKGLQANLFLAMNKKGRLYGEANGKDEATVFVEYVYGQYNLYLSRKWAHLGWYVGIKKSGKVKPGHQTRYGQKAIQFLPRRKRHW